LVGGSVTLSIPPREINADSESILLQGSEVGLARDVPVDANSGTLTLTGSSLDLDVSGRILEVDTNNFVLSGTETILEDFLMVTSNDFQLTGITQQVYLTKFITQPVNTGVSEGGSTSISGEATGQGGVSTGSYQWFDASGPTAITGQTFKIINITAATLADDGSQYFLRYTDEAGNSVDSNTVTLTVGQLPSITVQPVSQDATVNVQTSVSVTATGDAAYGTLTYQWYKNGSTLLGEVSATLNVTPSCSLFDGPACIEGSLDDYFVVVSNDVGSVTSETATITAIISPIILSQPSDTTIFENDTAIFSVFANANTESDVLTYQWYENAVAIPGATSESYASILTPLASNGNTFYCIVSGSTGLTTQSDTATLTVTQQTLQFRKQPLDQVVQPDATTVGFNVSATGTGTVTYQWYENGVAMTGETNTTLTVTAPFVSGSEYYVVVTDGLGSLQSRTVELTVLSKDIYSFTLPAAFGGDTVVVDKAVASTNSPRVFEQEFGDGYSQRTAAGIFSLNQEWRISISNRSADLIDRIEQYFRSLENIQAFNFVIMNNFISDNRETITVQCTEHSSVYTNVNTKTITATFKRTYEYLPPEAV
jgi:phage-related protein